MADLLEVLGGLDASVSEAVTTTKVCPDPFFTMSDVFDTTDDLTRLIRYYFVKNNIGVSKFKEMIRIYCQERGTATNKESTIKGNLISNLRALDKTITFRAAVQIWSILGLDLSDITIQFRNKRTGENIKLSTSDIGSKIRQPDPILNRCLEEYQERMNAAKNTTQGS